MLLIIALIKKVVINFDIVNPYITIDGRHILDNLQKFQILDYVH